MAATAPAPRPSVETRPLAAALLMLTATGAYACIALIARHLSSEVHAFEILFFRNIFGLVIMLPWLWQTIRPEVLATTRIGMHGVRAGFNSLSMGCWFLAVGLIPLADATAISFTAPLWVTIFAALFLGETVRIRRWAATLIGFAGILVILHPGLAEGGLDALSPGVLVALVAAAAWAITVVTLRTLARTERPETVLTWQVLLMAPISLPAALLVWTWPTTEALLWLALLAALATAGQFCHIRALALQDVTALQPIDFVKLPIIAGLALLLFGEEPSLWTIGGGIVVFCAASYVSWREGQLKRLRAASVVS
ncbi:MAG: DMT family transporter [Alphaproteobacteria bacterium]